jgi:cardiolipin synthase (CMP-forming)
VSQRLRQLPNVITSIRILLVVPIAIALLRGDLITALALFFIAAASDLADGYLAKRFGWQTVIGGILDPTADKALLATLFIVLGILKLVPLWLVATAVVRDLVIVAGAVAYRVCIGPLEARPSGISKLNTLCQGFFIMCVLGHAKFDLPPVWVVTALGALTFLTTVVSGIDYVLRYSKAALEEARTRRGSPSGGKLT